MGSPSFQAQLSMYTDMSLKRTDYYDDLYTSAKEIIQVLEEVDPELIHKVILILRLNERNLEKENSFVLSEWKELTHSQEAMKFSELIEVRLYYCEEDFDKEIALELKKELNRSIKSGMKFRSLRLEYYKGSMMTEEEAQVLVEGIGADHKEFLPPIFFRIQSSVGVGLLDRCLKIGWPVSKLYIESKDFKSADFDWEQIKRLLDNSNFPIRVMNEGDDTELNMHPIVQALLCAKGYIEIHGFDNIMRLPYAWLDPIFERWKNVTNDQVNTLKVTNYCTLLVKGCRIGLGSPDMRGILGWLARKYSNEDGRFLAIESMIFDDSKQRTKNEIVEFVKVIEPVQGLHTGCAHVEDSINLPAVQERDQVEYPA